MDKSKKNFWVIWSLVSIISFLLFLLGTKYLLGIQITVQNTIAYIIVSFIYGTVSSSLYLLKLKIVCVTFLTGLLVGFFQMFRMFFNDIGGWGDLAGLMSLFTWMAVGLCVGVVSQLGWYVYKKISLHRKAQ